jgi:hypothetical protein
MAMVVQFGLYVLMLQTALRSREIDKARPAVMRWFKTVLVWQLLVVLAAASYVALLGAHHPRGLAWVTPAVAAVFGTAIPLQVVVISVMRAGKR